MVGLKPNGFRATAFVVVASCLTLAVADRVDAHRTFDRASTWTVVPVPDPTPDYIRDVEVGPDGAVYITELLKEGLYRIGGGGWNPVDPLRWVPLPGYQPTYVAGGSDGNLYVEVFAEGGGRYLGVFTTSGQEVALHNCDPTPKGDLCSDTNLVLGPDGKVWFCELRHVASVSIDGLVSEYSIAKITREYNESPTIAVGPDRKIWFTIGGAYGVNPYLAKIDPGSNRIVAYNLPYPNCNQTAGLAVGGDLAMYVACESPSAPPLIARVTTTGTVSSIPYPPGFMWVVNTMTGGPDGNVYFSSGPSGSLGIYDPRKETLRTVSPPKWAIRPVTVGPDGNIWGGVNTIGIDIYNL